MRCTQAKRWLNLYVDGRLSPRRYALLERHLHVCATCRRELTFLETLRASVADAEGGRIPQPESEQLTASVMSRIAAFEEQRESVAAAKAQRRQARRRAVAPATRRAALSPVPAPAITHSGARPWIGLVWLNWARQSSAWATWRRWQSAGPSWRWMGAVLLLALAALAVVVWPAPFGQIMTPVMLAQLEPTRLLGVAEQWLLTPGPDAIVWAIWVAGAVVTLTAVAWFARADASAEWRRALVARLPQLW